MKELTELLLRVCRVYGIKPIELIEYNRTRKIVEIRTSFVRLAREMNPKPSLKLIGKLLERDHTSILWMEKEANTVKEKIYHYNDLKEKLSISEIIYHI